MRTDNLSRCIQVLLLFFLVIAGLYFAKSFLVPLVFAGVLAMLFIPLCRWFERRGLNRGFGSLICILLLLVLAAGVLVLLAWQVSGLAEDTEQMHKRAMEIVERVEKMISGSLGISSQKQEQIIKEQGASGMGGAARLLAAAVNSSAGLFINTILILVYTFLMIFLRAHLKKFVLLLVSDEQREKTVEIITGSSKVAQQYLPGLGKMIAVLWIMYGIGFSVVGVKHAIFFAILCGLLEIVPFVGNITGTAVTLLMGVSQGGDLKLVLGILGTYFVVQFIQTYILEPLVVGAQVQINPLFTIIAILAGELLWGIPGMVLAIPLLGIAKIVFDHIGQLRPYGFLIGEEKKPGKKIGDHLKKWFRK